jgi:glycine/D-amino acid oxidase-like deaminating enzyme
MDIIIVGAGIAGLGAGVGLPRAGHKVTVGTPCPIATLPSDLVQDPRKIIAATRSGRSHHDQAQCHAITTSAFFTVRTFQQSRQVTPIERIMYSVDFPKASGE